MDIVDSEGVPIHNDIIQDNRYGPSIAGIDILANLSAFTDNCFLTYGLNRDGYSQYEKIEDDPNTCTLSGGQGEYSYQQDIRTTRVPSETVPKIRILLKELHELNNQANLFFKKREEKAVEILEKGGGTQDTEYSLRLDYMNRRQHTANTNTIALVLIAVIMIFTIFTLGYLYFSGKIKNTLDYVILTLPISMYVLSVILGYLWIGNYSLFLS